MQKVMALPLVDEDPLNGVICIPNPLGRKKVPIKLCQKISGSGQHPIVGLNHIVEYIPVSDDGN